MKFKDLIPKHYLTKYRDEEGKQFACSWLMWFGKPFCIKHLQMSKE